MYIYTRIYPHISNGCRIIRGQIHQDMGTVQVPSFVWWIYGSMCFHNRCVYATYIIYIYIFSRVHIVRIFISWFCIFMVNGISFIYMYTYFHLYTYMLYIYIYKVYACVYTCVYIYTYSANVNVFTCM